MRRLLYLALVLVFLAIAGLAFVRVTSSGAYVARVKSMRLQPGMSRYQVHEIMADLPRLGSDCWQIKGGYGIMVCYELGPDGNYREPANPKVVGWFLDGPRERTLLDWTLERLGYARIRPHEDRDPIICTMD